MTIKSKKQFHWRSFITFYIIISFLIMSISGLILYFAPPGRVAYWTEWKFIALTKTNWQAIHTIFTFIFVAATVFHIYFNWKVITSYIKSKINESMKRKRELVYSSTFGLLIMIFTITNVPPFSTVMDFGDDLSNSWATQETEPPVPHAELLTVSEFADIIKKPPGFIVKKLNENNIKVPNSSITIKELAANYNITPKRLYEIIQDKNTYGSLSSLLGSGLGRKSLSDVSKQFNIPIQDVLLRLKSKGIAASFENNIRDLALKHNISPVEVFKMIKTN